MNFDGSGNNGSGEMDRGGVKFELPDTVLGVDVPNQPADLALRGKPKKSGDEGQTTLS